MSDTPQDSDAHARDEHLHQHPDELASDGVAVLDGVDAPTAEELEAARGNG